MAKVEAEKETTLEEDIKAAETARIVKAVELFDRDPEELAGDEDALKKIIEYLRFTRANIKVAELAGRKPSKKAAQTPAAGPTERIDPLQRLAGD